MKNLERKVLLFVNLYRIWNRTEFFMRMENDKKPPGNAGGLLLLYLLTEIVTLFPETATFA